MDRVYSLARTVIVWLGPDQGNAKDAIEGIERLVQHCRSQTDDLVDYDSRLWLRTGPRRGRYFTYESLPEDVMWESVKRLYSVPYLTGLWIIQEISLAERPICHYGDQSFSWFDLGVAAEWMIHRSYERYLGGFVRDIMNASIICNVRRGARDMDKLLMSSVHFDTGEPRDKAFGLLGLMRLSTAHLSIRPDYKELVSMVFTKATKSAILQHRRLRIIARITVIQGNERSHRMFELPSWVLQYAVEWQKGPKGIRNFNETGADGGKDMVIDEKTPLDILRIQGVHTATVSASTKRLTEAILDDDASLSSFINEFWAQTCSHSRTTAPLHVLHNALTTLYEARSTLPTTNEDLPADFHAFFQKCQLHASGQLDATLDQDVARSANAFRDHLRIASLLRSCFVTADGQAGQATAQIKQGDRVCILFGNDFPFILRPASEKYKLVGGAHLASVMNGDYVRDLERAGQLETQWFDIM